MSSFDNISSINSLNDLNYSNVSENKDYIILFIYWNKCGACHMTIPIICDLCNKLPKSFNCKIIKVHSPDITDPNLKKMSSNGVPIIQLLKRTKDGYKVYDYNSDGNEVFTTLGVSMSDQVVKGTNKKELSTKNTLIKWINHCKQNPLKENYKGKILYKTSKPKIEDDGSGYEIMDLNNSKNVSFNKYINKILKELKNIY